MPPPSPGPESLTFLAGVLVGLAIMFAIMAPLMAKGLEAHHHLLPSQHGRRRMILAYEGLAMAALCSAAAVLSYGTLMQPILFFVGPALGLVSAMALVSARGYGQRTQLSDQQETTAAAPKSHGPPVT